MSPEQPAQQDMYRRLADKYRQDLFACQDELNNLRSEYHNTMAELEGEIEELRSAQQGCVSESWKIAAKGAVEFAEDEQMVRDCPGVAAETIKGLANLILAANTQPPKEGSGDE